MQSYSHDFQKHYVRVRHCQTRVHTQTYAYNALTHTYTDIKTHFDNILDIIGSNKY